MLPHSVQGKTQPQHRHTQKPSTNQTISAKYTMRSTLDLQSTPKPKPIPTKLDLKGPMEHYC